MKVGMNLLLWTGHVTGEHYPVLERLARVGFDGVEVPVFEGSEAHYRELGAEIRRQGMRCSTITVCPADASAISADAALRAKALDRLKWVLDRTAAVGGDVLCGPYYAPLGQFSGHGASEDERRWGADVLRAGAEHAQALGVRIAVEFLCRFETYFLNTASEAVGFVKRVNHPALGMMYDTFHANIEELDPPAALAATRGSMIHFHVSENDRGVPGAGHVQWKETFRVLRQMKYDGWLTIEAFSRLLPELAAATRVWREFFDAPEDVYERGVTFIRRTWDEAGA